MTSRERVKISLNHHEPDRVPVDLGAMRSTGIAAIAYNNLLAELGLTDLRCRMYDFQQQIAYPDQVVRERFHVDAMDVGQAFLDHDDWREWPLHYGQKAFIPKYLSVEADEQGNMLLRNKEGRVVGRKPHTSLYTDQSYWPWKDLPSIPQAFEPSELSSHMWAVPCPPFHIDFVHDEQIFESFRKKIETMHRETDASLMISIGHNLFEQGTFMRGIDGFLADIYTDETGVARFLDSLLDIYMPTLQRILDGVKDYVDVIEFGDDLGTQQGTWISPAKLKGLFIPRYRKMWRYVHENSDCKVFLHSCGSVYDFLPMLIDAGLDILNPVQTNTANMEQKRLKAEFGKDLTFWGGGCSTQDILQRGTPEQVRDDVRRRIEVFAPGGGFVFTQIHNILADVPPRNVIAMFEAASEFGKY
jgi:uroporphyrinogen decarboxylase